MWVLFHFPPFLYVSWAFLLLLPHHSWPVVSYLILWCLYFLQWLTTLSGSCLILQIVWVRASPRKIQENTQKMDVLASFFSHPSPLERTTAQYWDVQQNLRLQQPLKTYIDSLNVIVPPLTDLLNKKKKLGFQCLNPPLIFLMIYTSRCHNELKQNDDICFLILKK